MSCFQQRKPDPVTWKWRTREDIRTF